MKIQTIISAVIIILLGPSYVASQSCLPDGITFTSQAQIDSFPINYPGCTEFLREQWFYAGRKSL